MASKTRVVKTATEGLLVLWEAKFFRTWRRMDAVVEALSERDNHFSDAELGMALKRAGHLTRRGKRRAYEYIQKYPFVAEADKSSAPKKGIKK